MRYIADSNGYIKEVSFGAMIECGGISCVEYTGSVPSGYASLEAWFLAECETLYKWKIEGGELKLDSSVPTPTDVPPFVPCWVTDLNEAVYSGWYRFGRNAANAPDSGGYWLRVDAYSTTFVHQEVYRDTECAIMSRWCLDGNWQPWEWVNPHMLIGTPCRTLGRYANRYPIYEIVVPVGYVSRGSNSFAHNLTMIQPLSADIFNNGRELLTGYYNITNFTVDRTHIHFDCDNDFGNIEVHIKYI